MNAKPATLKIHRYDNYRAFLHDFATKNRAKNPRWSYGLWANKLGLKSKSQLIMTVQGSRKLSPRLTQKLIHYFKFTPDEESYFKRLVSIETKEKTTIHQVKMDGSEKAESPISLNSDSPLMRESWLAFVVKEAATLMGAKINADLIANSICTKPEKAQVEQILKSLVEAGYLAKNSDVDGQPIYAAMKNSPEIHWPRESIEKMHSDGLRACENQGKKLSSSERVFQTSFIRIRKERLAEAKILIRAFQKEFMREMEADEGNEVVQFNLHLFPVASDLKG
jgi:uncharacterized protein (TIGR02147 family)